MYWDYDRLSTSGQNTLDEIATLVGLETKQEETKRKGRLHDLQTNDS